MFDLSHAPMIKVQYMSNPLYFACVVFEDFCLIVFHQDFQFGPVCPAKEEDFAGFLSLSLLGGLKFTFCSAHGHLGQTSKQFHLHGWVYGQEYIKHLDKTIS